MKCFIPPLCSLRTCVYYSLKLAFQYVGGAADDGAEDNLKKKPIMHLRREEGARTIATVTIDVRAWAFHCFIPSCSGQIIAKFYLYCNRSCRQNLCSSFWADVWVGASWSLSLLKKHRSCLVRPVTRLSAVCLILDKLRKREKKNRSTPEGFDHTRAYGHSGQSYCNSSSSEFFS